jgi:hypothetical protein
MRVPLTDPAQTVHDGDEAAVVWVAVVWFAVVFAGVAVVFARVDVVFARVDVVFARVAVVFARVAVVFARVVGGGLGALAETLGLGKRLRLSPWLSALLIMQVSRNNSGISS